MTTKAERLLTRLRPELKAFGSIELPEGTELRRTYASGSRNEGAWSWFAYHREEGTRSLGGLHRDIGSCYPVSVLLGCRSWTISDTEFGVHVDPCPECIIRYGRVRF